MEMSNLIHALVTSIPGKELPAQLYEYRRPSGAQNRHGMVQMRGCKSILGSDIWKFIIQSNARLGCISLIYKHKFTHGLN
jgi:hypothetical protein